MNAYERYSQIIERESDVIDLIVAARALLAYVEGGPISAFGRERCERLRVVLDKVSA